MVTFLSIDSWSPHWTTLLLRPPEVSLEGGVIDRNWFKFWSNSEVFILIRLIVSPCLVYDNNLKWHYKRQNTTDISFIYNCWWFTWFWWTLGRKKNHVSGNWLCNFRISTNFDCSCYHVNKKDIFLSLLSLDVRTCHTNPTHLYPDVEKLCEHSGLAE